MLDAQRSCLDLAQQLHAVEAAVGVAKRQLIHEQMQHCLAADATPGAPLRELKRLTRYL